MYPFVEKLHPECAVSPADIAALEQQYEILIPPVLRDFYLNANAAETMLCRTSPRGPQQDRFEVHVIYPVKYSPYENGVILENVISGDRMDGFIPPELVPFAEDRGGDRYYYHQGTENVYFIPVDDIDTPLLVCQDLSAFFHDLAPV